ncbi:Signal transduction histidine kinase [Sporobacter termitidis DSM 10068]|uniref:histidine kinase n=1 Tax=Sporobacter termitidis DSM 10068 TaxID=1123282 RepID=A0A1M5YEX4_9FIRM|nr:HAMP domain-containing sensor histidine kinase [Sporobacter termitidis]SHI10567.1 Signal transduction histidine kinase [Sporobacter termitidis DSM 10068]
MNDINNTKTTQEPPAKFRNSIARKLSSRMVLRLFGIFISLDILLGLITGACLIAYSEEKAARAASLLSVAEAPPPPSPDWLSLSGVSIDASDVVTPGNNVSMPFYYLLPDATRDAKRSIETHDGRGLRFQDSIEDVDYVVYYKSGTAEYRISVSLRSVLHIVYIGAAVLLGYELLVLLGRIRKDRRMVRATLDPITELTRAAQDLNAVSRQLDPAMMAALAGKLEGINAARLDTRIQVDDTQAELKSLARAINGMLDRINESYRAQVRFVSDASHELRTPISVIQGYANLLDRWGKNDEKALQESITAIKEEASGMKDLVEQLLFLARGDNNTIMLQPETFSLRELAEEVAAETKMIDPAHDYATELKDAAVTADRSLIKQALRILVDNAIKYTDAGEKITILTDDDGATAKLGVRDNGIGISPDNVPRIFDRFYRADESRARATGGAGLGLSIASWITSRHGGYLEVLSREGLGTKITISLPKGEPAAMPPAAGPESDG